MAAYAYQALDAKGRKKSGILEADTERQVRQQLREKSLIPISVEEAETGNRIQKKEGLPLLKKGQPLLRRRAARISSGDLALISRQMASLVGGGLPLEQVLQAVAEQTEKPRLQGLVMAVRSKVVEGYSLAESMAEYPYVFDKLFTSMVAAGERSGHLDEVLERLADYTEQRNKLRGQLMQALAYPAILTMVAVAVIVFLLVSVVPGIVEQFVQLDASLPTTTTVLLSISGFLQAAWLYILLALVSAYVGLKFALRRPTFRDRYDGWLLRLPLVGKVIRGVNTSRFSRTLSILTASAVPLLEGLTITGRIISNRAMQIALKEAADRVREGASLRAALAQSKLFPPMMLHMIAAGERSGELEDMLGRAADNQDRDFEQTMNIALKVFEPLLIVTMAGAVLFIILAIIQPIMALNQAIGL
ncbi:type II secretion system inner membrane protein GspF [Pseudidiomarina taiwanensis]|uniref:General secretion pathway protein F n=1 Tax=Pseudidiomarina taiwanensis TaxID=337250 RepID=A0A432ZKJ6_9GAMM|nr:type II secretion system inner membrane protein GspF [Pseudidiomarina taiwanensis]RUO78433.1 type II secretion system protein GspF [Pseudidiomarina taiwanensis]